MVFKIRCKIMGFDVNSTASNKPVIREAASMHNDGGGGNLGYFERGENKEKKHNEESIFAHGEEADSFSKGSDVNEEVESFSITKFIANLIFEVKEFLKRLAPKSK